MIYKDCIYHLIRIKNSNFETLILKSILIMNACLEMFLDDLLIIPVKRKINFGIGIFIGCRSISISSYYMALAKLKELKDQLKDLLSKRFIRLSIFR